MDEALNQIHEGLKGEQTYLKCRWNKLNYALLGGWRFSNNYVLAGDSGAGKSYMLNMLFQDFINPELNAGFHKPFKILHFSFEMSAADEVLRTLSGKSGQSYRDILSVDSPLRDDKLHLIKDWAKSIRGAPIYFVETSGNLDQMYNTIMVFQAQYPSHQLVISIDHTLLADMKGEKDEIELVAKLAKMFVKIRKLIGSMGIQLAQLNADIEDKFRIKEPTQHYPQKKDLHGSKQIFHAADVVLVIHRPYLLGITQYGPSRYPTVEEGFENGVARKKTLVACHLLKVRKGSPGLIRLKDELYKGNMVEWNLEENQL